MTLTAAEAHQLKVAPPVEGVDSIFLNRWSPRSFSDRAVDDADLVKCFEAARWTSSALNQQPWRFLVARKGSETHRKIFESMQAKGKSWIHSAPVLVLAVAKTSFDYKEGVNKYAVYDLGGAATSFCLQATALGLSTRQCASIEPDLMRAAFQAPDDYTPYLVIAVGYQGEPAALEDENYSSQEQSARKRKALEEIVWSDWNTPANLK
jgi:nitroreductase